MRTGCLAIVLHAHLPFVRHPEHERFLEETWLHEAVVECYLPLLLMFEGWGRDRLPARLSLSLSPTLGAMLADPLLKQRCRRHLDALIDLAGAEVVRHHWDAARQKIAQFYHDRLSSLRRAYEERGGDLLGGFGRLQVSGQLDLLTCSATHAVLPLHRSHPGSIRAQIRAACRQHQQWFGAPPRGFWLPECAYAPELDEHLAEAGVRWFVVETHGLLQARPRPRYGVFAPVITPSGLAAFGRDPSCARQVWSRQAGYPGAPDYRDFYRDIGFDLDLEYLRPNLPAGPARSYTGLKYHRIAGGQSDKALYDRALALQTASAHAAHFLRTRLKRARRLGEIMDQPPVFVAPYDAELLGHWWFEGPEFLDAVARQAQTEAPGLTLLTLENYLARQPAHFVATPNASSWGEGGHLKVWLNEKNAWLYPRLRAAQDRMAALARGAGAAEGLAGRFLRQAGCELLLAQASDWPFMIETGSSPDYARRRLEEHLARFQLLADRLDSGQLDEALLAGIEATDNLLPGLDVRWWA